MEVLRLKLHQHNAVYRNPASGEIIETYPLVPPSTVLGMISSMLEEQELHPGSFDLGIQGTYGSLVRDYQWYKKYNQETKSYRVYPLLVHSLYDINLLIHVYTKDYLPELERLFKFPPYYLYLGRAEDIIKIEDVQVVHVDKQKVTGLLDFNMNAYISKKDAQDLYFSGGVEYFLTTYSNQIPFTIKGRTKLIRDFKWANVMYVEKGPIEIKADIDNFECWSDGENLVWWSMQNPNP